MTDKPAFTHPLVVAHLPDGGATFRLAPDEAVRTALAEELGIVGIPALAATVNVTPEAGGGVRVEGHVEATVRQTCVATLEPFDAPVSEDIDMHFVPAEALPEARPGAEIEVELDQIADPLVDGVIDIGAAVSEFLALGLDPYPRKPGATFEPLVEDVETESPFAALSRLRRGGPGSGGEEQ